MSLIRPSTTLLDNIARDELAQHLKTLSAFVSEEDPVIDIDEIVQTLLEVVIMIEKNAVAQQQLLFGYIEGVHERLKSVEEVFDSSWKMHMEDHKALFEDAVETERRITELRGKVTEHDEGLSNLHEAAEALDDRMTSIEELVDPDE